jgi:tetratricopeptide (TPR) repeat protein
MRVTRHPLLVVAMLGMGVAVPALAQQPQSYPAACEASKVSKGDVDRAHTVFLSGKGFLDEANYDKAISYFKDAYSIDCSVHAILPIIATAYERKGDKASAVQALQEYLKRVPNDPDREKIERRIKNLQDQMTPVAVTTAPASATPTAPNATGVATAPTGSAATTAPTSTPTSGPPEEGGHTIAPWIVVGVGGAAVLTGVVLYIVGSGKVSNAEAACGANHDKCPANSPAIADGNSGRTLETVGVIAGAVGIAAVAGGLVWHFMEPTSASGPAAGLAPVVTPGYAGIALDGRF